MSAPLLAGSIPGSLAVDPSGKFAYAVGGGNQSWISAYTLNATSGALSEIAGSPLATSRWGPQSLAVDRSGRFVYVANSGWNGSPEDNVSAYAINATTGALSEIAGSPFAARIAPSSVTVDPSGRFVYVANAYSGIVSAYTINATTGALISIGAAGAGPQPSSVTVDPSGNFAYVANLGGNSVTVYTINATTGILTSTGAAVAAGINPYSVTVDPSGKFVYAANRGSNNVSAYAINATTGALTSIGTVPVGSNPVSIVTTRRIQ